MIRLGMKTKFFCSSQTACTSVSNLHSLFHAGKQAKLIAYGRLTASNVRKKARTSKKVYFKKLIQKMLFSYKN